MKINEVFSNINDTEDPAEVYKIINLHYRWLLENKESLPIELIVAYQEDIKEAIDDFISVLAGTNMLSVRKLNILTNIRNTI